MTQGSREQLGKPRAHLAGLGWRRASLCRQEARDWWREIGPVFIARPRGVATGRGLGEEQAAQAETIYLEHEEQLGREASSAALQGHARREERMPGANAASSPVSCPLLPCCLGIQPLRPQQGHHQPFPSPRPLLRLPFPVGYPPRQQALPTAESTAPRSPLPCGL